MEYDNTNRGKLGRNLKPKSEKSPEYTGRIIIEGKDYFLSGWIRTNSKDGSKFFSLTVSPFEDTKPAPQPSINELSDDIPF